jgi:hypothetical protein
MKRIPLFIIAFLLIVGQLWAIPPSPPTVSTVATTQTAANKSTSIATTAYVDTPTTQTWTISPSGDGNHGTGTLTPTPNVSRVSIDAICGDTDGCTASISETGAIGGARISINNSSAYHIDFSTSAGTVYLSGGTPFAMAQFESLELEYLNGNWFEVSRATGTTGPYTSWVIPYGTSAAPTAEGSIYHNSTTDTTTIGNGASADILMKGTVGASLTPVIDDPDNFAANFTTVNLYGGTFIANAAGTAALPAVVAGMNFTIVLEGANAVILNPDSGGTADTIVMNGLAAAQDENITSSTSGAMCVFQYRAANSWMATCNGFAEATPP